MYIVVSNNKASERHPGRGEDWKTDVLHSVFDVGAHGKSTERGNVYHHAGFA